MKNLKDYPRYAVTEYGKVINTDTGRVLKEDTNSCGYKRVTVSKDNKTKRFFVHRLVALYYLDPPENGLDQVNHKNGNKSDNRAENLEWCNQSLNQTHAVKMGLQPRVTKISEEAVHEICALLEEGKATKHILKIIHTTRNIVVDIKRKKTWLCVSNGYNF